MQQLVIEAGTSSPFVHFDPDSGQLAIGGESYPENSYEFYGPVLAWLDAYLGGRTAPVKLTISLTYLNTSSTKYMIDILDRLEAAHENGVSVEVVWHCDPHNQRARDAIEELKEDFAMPFAIVEQEVER